MTKNIFVESISVNNFRSLNSLVGNGFGKINIITGKNNVGKTSLLEAIYLNLGPANPSLAVNVLGRHGLSRLSSRESNINFLFSGAEISNPIKFKLKSNNYGTRDLEIKLRDATPSEVKGLNAEGDQKKSNNEPILGADPPKVLELTSRRVGEKTLVSHLLISEAGGFPFGDLVSLYPESVYISADASPVLDNEVQRYDAINKSNLLSKFEEILRTIEPNLIRTSLGLNNGLSTILADVGYGLLPLTLLGSGSQKLARFFLALAFANNGVVLIDEFDGSFHYSSLVPIWKSIIEFVQVNNVQIFAATHSNECLQAIHQASQQRDFSGLVVHRMERQDGESKLFTLSGEELSTMLEKNWELR